MDHQTRLWALQEPGAENHGDLKEPLVEVHRQKTQTTYNVPIIFKIKHVVKYALLSKDIMLKFFLFNHAVSMSHHL